MPVVWNSETEAKLLAGIFKVCDLKVSGAQMKELAELIGPDCTAKAVTHRIAKFRTQAGAFNGGKAGAEKAGGDDSKNDGASEPATPATGKKATPAQKTPAKKTPAKKRKIAEVEEGGDDEGGKQEKKVVKSEEGMDDEKEEAGIAKFLSGDAGEGGMFGVGI